MKKRHMLTACGKKEPKADPEELHEVSADQAQVVKELTQKLKGLPAFTP